MNQGTLHVRRRFVPLWLAKKLFGWANRHECGFWLLYREATETDKAKLAAKADAPA